MPSPIRPGAFAPLALVALVALTLGAGCAETSTSPSYAPGASYPPHRPTAWQQFCEQAANVPQASALAGARGAEGWELVAMYNGVLCYKRPAPLPVAPLGPSAPAGSAPGGSFVPVVRDPGF